MKRVIAIVTVVMVTLITCVPAFAYSDEDLLSTFVNVDEFLFRLDDRYSYSWKYIKFESDTPVFIYRNSSTCYLITRSADSEVERIVLDASMNEQSRSTVIMSQVYWTNPDDSSDVIYTTANHRPVIDGLPGTYTPDLLAANTVLGSWNQNTIVTGFKAFEEIYVPPVEPYVGQFRIPSGYVAYFKAQNGSSFTMTANYGFNSVAFVDDWGQTGQVMTTGVSSLPSSGTKFPLSGMYKIPFRRSENRNLLGQSKVGVYSSTFHGSGYYVIYNPYYMKDFTNLYGSAFELNPTITLSAEAIYSFRLYPLSQTFDGATSDDWGSESLSGYEDYIDGSVDDEGNPIYQDQTGVVVPPPSDGGTNQVVTPVTNQSIIDRVTSIFNDLISKITSVFTEGYQAIVNLVGLAGPFFAKLSSLYSWLPAPVLSCLTSAMILAVTIGILRAFL